MKIRHVVVPGLIGLALAGCHSDPEVAYLQRDNLKKEREIERLQYRVEELEESLNSAAPVQPGITSGVPPVMHTMEDQPGPASTRPGPALTPPARTNPEPEISLPGVLVSPGTPVPEVPERMRVPGSGGPTRQGPPPGELPAGESSQWSPAGGRPLPGALAPAENSVVAQITLHPALTGGIGSGGQPGDEGLLVVVEPRDFGGNIIHAPGDISVALLDPALSGEQARLARWDFSAAETQGMIRTGSQPGIHLRLPWTATPAHDRLKVFVRYTTRDGRKLQVERLIGVALSGSPPARREAVADFDATETASRPQRPQWSPVR
jgi:hypothetical protein